MKRQFKRGPFPRPFFWIHFDNEIVIKGPQKIGVEFTESFPNLSPNRVSHDGASFHFDSHPQAEMTQPIQTTKNRTNPKPKNFALIKELLKVAASSNPILG